MNIFKSGTLTWWQVGVLKVSVLCIGIAVGANWPDVFVSHTLLLVAVGIVLGLYLLFPWFGKK